MARRAMRISEKRLMSRLFGVLAVAGLIAGIIFSITHYIDPLPAFVLTCRLGGRGRVLRLGADQSPTRSASSTAGELSGCEVDQFTRRRTRAAVTGAPCARCSSRE